MNKNDIERMVSLADERYVEEMLEERITYHGRKRSVFPVFAATAAAMAVTLGGIWHFVNTAGIEEPLPPVATIAEDFAEQPFDYAELFKNKLEEKSADLLEDLVIDSYYTPEGYASGDKKVVFGDEITKALMPFDAGYFNYTETTLYYDGEDSVEFIRVQLGRNLDGKTDKMCRVTVCREGGLLSKMNLDGFVPTERLGAEVYGFELDWREDRSKGAVFAANGSEYMVESVKNMTYNDLGAIIDALIEKGIHASDFDVLTGQQTEGYYGKQLTLAEANLTEPFVGYVSQSTHIGSLELNDVSYGENTFNGTIDYKYLNVSYVREEPYNFIHLAYGTFREDPLTTVPFEYALDKLDSFAEPTSTNGVFSYTFAIECGEFWIKVSANCTPEEMALCIRNIRGGNNIDVSLVEANIIEPFAGYVPQESSLAGTTLWLYRGVTYVTQTENNEITSQLMVFTFKDFADGYITCYYYTNNEAPYGSVINIKDITLESLDGFRADGEYKFTADCGKFMINIRAKCSPDELMKYIDAIRGGDVVSGTVTLAEANNIVPFAGHVPQFENIGNMKLFDPTLSESAEYGKTLKISYDIPLYLSNIHQLSATFTEKKAWRENNEPLVTLGEITKEGLEKFKTDEISYDGTGYYQFAVDCGGFFVTVNAWCTPEELWEYISAINPGAAEKAEQERKDAEKAEQERIAAEKAEQERKDAEKAEQDRIAAEKAEQERKAAEKAEQKRIEEEQKRIDEQNAAFERIVKGGSETLTFEKVRKLAEKGDKLDWSDFENFSGTAVGSGLFIMAYSVENTDYWVNVGGVPGEKPWYVYLSKSGDDKRIDIRYDSIDDFLDSNPQITLTTDKIKELAKKGDDLTWSDFDGYTFTEGGSGLYIRTYRVEGGYSLNIGGGSPYEKPMYINLSGNGKGKIDIRYDSIDDFLNK